MSQKAYQRIVERIRSTDGATILRIAGRCDGHTILKPQSLVDAGLHSGVVKFITHTHQSDGTPKGTLFVDGRPVQELTGVYGLDLLRLLANALNVSYRSALGRGFEAQNIQSALRQHFESTTQPQS